MAPSRHLLATASLAWVAAVVACSSSDSATDSASGADGGAKGADATTLEDSAAPQPGTDAATDATTGDATPDSPFTAFTLTSTVLAEGASFPQKNTCTGDNESPPLAWAGSPTGAMSFAVVLEDESITTIHSVIYDIPASATSLPAAVQKAYAPNPPAGAHQTKPGFGGGFGYLGPCPPVEHSYAFTIYALDVAALPGATMTTTTVEAAAIIQTHTIVSARLTGKYAQP
jgi:Raf kinase inhibitor-like YbhB/YbcL family protein